MSRRRGKGSNANQRVKFPQAETPKQTDRSLPILDGKASLRYIPVSDFMKHPDEGWQSRIKRVLSGKQLDQLCLEADRIDAAALPIPDDVLVKMPVVIPGDPHLVLRHQDIIIASSLTYSEVRVIAPNEDVNHLDLLREIARIESRLIQASKDAVDEDDEVLLFEAYS